MNRPNNNGRPSGLEQGVKVANKNLPIEGASKTYESFNTPISNTFNRYEQNETSTSLYRNEPVPNSYPKITQSHLPQLSKRLPSLREVFADVLNFPRASARHNAPDDLKEGSFPLANIHSIKANSIYFNSNHNTQVNYSSQKNSNYNISTNSGLDNCNGSYRKGNNSRNSPGYEKSSRRVYQPYNNRLNSNHKTIYQKPTDAYPIQCNALEMSQSINNGITLNSKLKRTRRRYDEITRLFQCNYGTCKKSYGTLNHLNSHILLQSHGPKRALHEFNQILASYHSN